MKTSTRETLSALILTAGLVAALGGCRPERSATTEEPEMSAPAPGAPGAPGATGSAGSQPVLNATQGAGDLDPDAPTLAVAGVAFSRPEGWALASPGPMRAAELRHPAMPDGAIVFTHFGERGAGTVPDNLTRWARQVVDSEGEPTLPEVTEMNADAGGATRRITFARYEGTYLMGTPGQTPTPMPGTLFLGAIVEGGPSGTVYMRAFGPRDAMADHVEAILAMLLPPETDEQPQ